MISVVVYGRNDSYGYNLHKRAAISLNCFAEVLGAPDDELIFVDYNSADELPTFPEAIADTLTARARAVLRILRVRPEIHARYTGRTHLAALEPIARNVGVRRSNPANRWILSTNTDDVLVLRNAQNLAAAVGDLPSAHYHTARFEVPESLWEAFDRSDPGRTIEELRSLGRSARLNEVVYASETILFDGPGDFQLIERAQLFEIDGFDESMLRGWHVDSNIAKRLSFNQGAVRSLLDEVLCYHCDHTKQLTAAHKPDQIGNDPERFVDRVTRPDLPEQRQVWGCAEDDIEEIRLAQNGETGYRRALRALVKPLDLDFSEAYLTPATFDRGDYDPHHILPFLADFINHLPRDTVLAWCGHRADMFELFLQLWREFGFTQPIAVHGWIAASLLTTPREGAQIRSHHAWLADADLFVFEFGGAGSQMPPLTNCPDRSIGLEVLTKLQSLFLSAVANERSRRALAPCTPARRFVGIDCIHNRTEMLFATYIGAAATPFGSRLRYGVVASPGEEPEPGAAIRLLIGRALGRRRPIAPKELAFAEALFAPLLAGDAISTELQHRAGCYATLGQAFIAAINSTQNPTPVPERVERALQQLDRLRPSRAIAAELGIAWDEPRRSKTAERSLSRFVADEDWDDPSWSACADYFVTDPDASHLYRRDAALWEQIHLLYGLNRAGLPTDNARLLVVATMPDAVIAALSRRAATVEVFSLASEAPFDNFGAACAFWCGAAAYDAESLTILPQGSAIEELSPGTYDAVVFPHGAIFGMGLEAVSDWLRAAERLLRPSGVLAFKSEIAAGRYSQPDHLDIRAVLLDGLATRLSASTAFVVDGGFDAMLTPTTADKVWSVTGPVAGEQYFLSRQNGRILIPSYWFLTKRETAARSEWEELRRWLGARWSGEQIELLQVGDVGRRRDDGRIASTPGRRGHVFFGPYVAVPDGRYRVTLRFQKTDAAGARPAPATLEAVVNGTIIARCGITRTEWAAGVLEMNFDVREAQKTGHAGILEIRLHSPGGLSVIIEGVDLQLREAFASPNPPPLPMASGRMTGDADLVQNVLCLERREMDAPISPKTASTGRPLSRTATNSDWQDTAWSRFFDAVVAGRRSEGASRDAGTWERTHLLYGLERCGKLDLAARVLVAATMPDEIIGLLSEYVGRVDVLDLPRLSLCSGPEARLRWSNNAPYARDRLAVREPSGEAASLEAHPYDAIVFPHSSLFLTGVPGIARLLASANRLLAAHGVVVFKADILTGEKPDADHLDMGIFGEERIIEQIAADTGFALEDGFEAGPGENITEGDPAREGLMSHHRGRLAFPSLWFLRKQRDAGTDEWQRLEGRLSKRLLGDQIERLELGPAGRRDGNRISTDGAADGIVFFGPYLGLPSGRYEAVVAIEPGPANRGQLVIDVAAGGKRLHKQTVKLDRNGGMTVTLPFTVPPPRGASVDRVEIRAWRSGGQAAFTACRLLMLEG